MLKQVFNNLFTSSVYKTVVTCSRNVATKKRFYKNCQVVSSNGRYEVALDQRKLKTPKGNPFQVESEPLALAVATEWDSQKEKISLSTMHLTGLCSTVIDNPDKLTKEDITNELVSYVENDTILYYSAEEDELYDLQLAQWSPIAEWLCKRYHVNIQPTKEITGPVISENDKEKLRKYFLSYNLWSLYGFRFSIEALKSVILGLACADRFLTVEKATSLSRLEEDFQSGRWGRVEWAHDLNEQSTRARVAAGTLFIHLNSSIHFLKQKQALG